MGRRLPPWRQSRQPSLSATVGPESVLASPVIAFIVDSHVAGRVLRERSDRPACRRLVIPLPRTRSSEREPDGGARRRRRDFCQTDGGLGPLPLSR
jgi:hypothetical protein